jgi:DNA polymerase III delta prime subunit
VPIPRWLVDLERLLPIRSQFVVSGSIRDSFLTPLGSGAAMVPLLRALWETVKLRGYQFLLVFDPVDGLRVYPDEPAAREFAETLFGLKLANGAQVMSLESLAALMKELCRQREARVALVVDFASRLTRQAAHLGEAEQRFFVAAEKLSLHAAPMVPKTNTIDYSAAPPPSPPSTSALPLFNPIIWLVNRAQDLPSWLTLDSERIASMIIGKPDFETRQACARQLAPLFAGFVPFADGTLATTAIELAAEAARKQFVKKFTEGTEGMSLTALADITELADRQKLSMGDIDDAIRCYKVGVKENPWRKDYLREKIRNAHSFIEDRVKGQHPAVVKTLDILKRSVMGLTGAQARAGGSRPRGVLFFAGPTGVGKTELAKTLTQLVFGDERAYLRFDMSEFAEEHTSARLLGAPPGYVGFDAGGELTNAVREKPFSVVLFDEIEKAHPRILDKFLQILEDGRLTDGRGDTAYFSETILVFTSNLGIYVEDAAGQRIQNVRPGDEYEVVEHKVREAINDYFKFRLSRPELLNRIGDNIVVFNFITPEVAERIFDGMLYNVARRLQEENKLRLTMPVTVRKTLLERCTHDLGNGGRGIGNQLESMFINPLARALFEQDLEGKKTVSISSISEQGKVLTLNLTVS